MPLLTAMIAITAQAAHHAAPSQFYVVSVFFTDFGQPFYYRLIEVRPKDAGSIVRYVRVAPASAFCPRVVVQGVEARVSKSPAELTSDYNPCLVEPKTLRRATGEYSRKVGVFETISFGVVAECGSSTISLGLPIAERVDLARLQKAHPEMARLWHLASEIAKAAFGPKDVFHDRTGTEDLELQRAGQRFVPELASGRYDAGLAAAVRGNTGKWESPTFRDLLADYRGPVRAEEADPLPQLLNAQAYEFTHFVTPAYSRLAKAARIQGRVDLQLTVEPSTGQVLAVQGTSGHPLLTPGAVRAAQQWRFKPGSVASRMLTVTIEFDLCR